MSRQRREGLAALAACAAMAALLAAASCSVAPSPGEEAAAKPDADAAQIPYDPSDYGPSLRLVQLPDGTRCAALLSYHARAAALSCDWGGK